MEYAVVLAVTLAVSPFILRLAANQNKKTKQNLRTIYFYLLVAAALTSFFAAVIYSVVVIITQIILLWLKKTVLDNLAVFLNFANIIVFFLTMILGRNQEFNIAALVAIFLILAGNVIGLVLINKDRKFIFYG